MTMVETREEWTPQNWMQLHKARQARLMSGRTMPKAAVRDVKVVSSPETWTPKMWREHRKERQAEATKLAKWKAPKECGKPTVRYLTPIGPRWHTDMYEQPIGPVPLAGTRVSVNVIRRIECEVAKKHFLSVADLRTRDRHAHMVRARQELWWRCCTEAYGWSLPAIGHATGQFDHTTVLHGRRRHQARIDAGEDTDLILPPDALPASQRRCVTRDRRGE